jgi:hypothetical protein
VTNSQGTFCAKWRGLLRTNDSSVERAISLVEFDLPTIPWGIALVPRLLLSTRNQGIPP